MPSFHRIASIAAAIVAIMPTTAWADIPCPSEDERRSPDSPPYPTIASYTVTRATAPASERESGSHEVTVIGGDAAEGEVRIDLQLSRDLPRNCPLSVIIVDPAVSDSEQRSGGGDAAKVFRITEPDRIQTMAVRTEAPFYAFSLRGDGTNRLSLRARTLGQFGDHTARLGLRVRFTGPVYPFTVIRRGLPDIAASLSAGTTRFGDTVEVVAALPFTPGPGAIDDKVTFTVKPTGAGNFRRPNDLRSIAPTLSEPLDTDLTPRRAMVIFVPAAVPKPVNAVITATLMGRSKDMPVMIRQVPKPCAPKAAWSVVKGGVELTLTNQGEIPCPAMAVSVLAEAVPMPRGTTQQSGMIYGVPEMPQARTAPSGASLFAPAAAAPVSTTRPTSWTGMFQLDAPYPIAGFTVTATARPIDGSFPTITLPSLNAVPVTPRKLR